MLSLTTKIWRDAGAKPEKDRGDRWPADLGGQLETAAHGSRFMGWLSYGLLRLMMGISGYALEKPKGGDSATSLSSMRKSSSSDCAVRDGRSCSAR